jgi:hypothetical protein
MTLLVAVRRGRRFPRSLRRAAGGAAGALGLLGVCLVVSVAAHRPASAGLVTTCCRYFPERLARGEVWTVTGSAFFLPDVRMVAPTTLVTMLLFFPYAVAAGARPALRTFFTGHVLATVAVAAVVLPGTALGWPSAVALSTRSDVGASAGLAAVAGAACLLPATRRVGPALLAVFALGFAMSLARGHRVVDVEHLIALGTGAVSEWNRRRRHPRPGALPDSPQMRSPAAPRRNWTLPPMATRPGDVMIGEQNGGRRRRWWTG